jgi:hypothetical protein
MVEYSTEAPLQQEGENDPDNASLKRGREPRLSRNASENLIKRMAYIFEGRDHIHYQ